MKVKKMARKFLAGRYPVFLEDTPLGDCCGTIRTDIVGFLVNGRYHDCTHGTKLFWAIWSEAVASGWKGSHWDSPFTYGSCDSLSGFSRNEKWDPALTVRAWNGWRCWCDAAEKAAKRLTEDNALG